MILNIVLIFIFSPAAWQISKDNELIAKTIEMRETFDIALNIKHVQPGSDGGQIDPRYQLPPPYNPYMTEQETTRDAGS